MHQKFLLVVSLLLLTDVYGGKRIHHLRKTLLYTGRQQQGHNSKKCPNNKKPNSRLNFKNTDPENNKREKLTIGQRDDLRWAAALQQEDEVQLEATSSKTNTTIPDSWEDRTTEIIL